MRDERLNLLRKQLVAPEIEHVNARFDLKMAMGTDELRKTLSDEMKRIEF